MGLSIIPAIETMQADARLPSQAGVIQETGFLEGHRSVELVRLLPPFFQEWRPSSTISYLFMSGDKS